MFTLRIFVMGLVALVKGPDDGSLTIVLQQVYDHASRHYPVLIYPRGPECQPGSADGACQAYDAATIAVRLMAKGNALLDKDDNQTWLRHEDKQFGGVLLDGRRLRLRNAAHGALEFVLDARRHHPGDERGALPTSAEELEDFSWVPDMAQIWPQDTYAAPSMVDQPSRVQVAGIFQLTGVRGKVKTYKVADTSTCTLVDRKPTIYSIDFRTPQQAAASTGGVLRQALAEILLIEVQVAGPEAVMKILPLKDSPARQLAPISLRPDPQSGTADVLVGNLVPLPELAGCDYSPDPHHFDVYYQLAAERGSTADDHALPFPGVHKIPSAGINPSVHDLPPIVKVVSVKEPITGVYNRPVCTLLLYQRHP